MLRTIGGPLILLTVAPLAILGYINHKLVTEHNLALNTTNSQITTQTQKLLLDNWTHQQQLQPSEPKQIPESLALHFANNPITSHADLKSQSQYYLVNDQKLINLATYKGQPTASKLLSSSIPDTPLTTVWRQRQLNPAASQHKPLSFTVATYTNHLQQVVSGSIWEIQLEHFHGALISERPLTISTLHADNLRTALVTTILLSLIIAIIAGLWLASRISTPIRQLAENVRRRINGSSKASLIVHGNIEINRLSSHFELLLKRNQTKTQRVSELLKELQERQFAIDQHSIVVVTNASGIISYANDHFCQLSGYSREDLIDQNHEILNSDEHDDSFFEDMYRTLRRRKVWKGDICNRNKNGDIYWINSTIVPKLDEQGKIATIVSISTDISRVKQDQLELEQSAARATAANEAKDQFMANISHEIRTPMNGIIGMLGLVEDSQLTTRQRDYVHTAKLSAESLLAIINDILDFSKVDANKLALEQIDFNVAQLIRSVGMSLRTQAHAKDLEFICPAQPLPKLSLRGDPGRIRQILNNLIGNAIKFTQQGEIAVHCELHRLTDNYTKLSIKVTDTGIGLTPQQIDSLFDRFTQADVSNTRKYGGTGLGLAISKQLVDLMDGSIEVSSEVGAGTSFEVNLRLPNGNPISSDNNHQQLAGKRVLVVDDNDTNCKLMHGILENWQVAHDICTSAKQAIQQIHAAQEQDILYDIALLDYQMPEMNGLSLGQEIQQIPLKKPLELIMLSSCDFQGLADQSIDNGFKAYLTKPIDMEELLDKMLSNDSVVADLPHPQPQTEELPQFRARILVVEDNPTNQKVAQGMLHRFGLYVDLVADGIEALDILNRLPYDLVLMDCQMPELDGYETTRRIRSGAASVLDPEIPIIALTANAMSDDEQKCYAAGMNDYLSKPLQIETLSKRLLNWLSHMQKEEEKPSQQPRTFTDSVVISTPTPTAPLIATPASNHVKPTSGRINRPAAAGFDYEQLLQRMGDDAEICDTILDLFIEDGHGLIHELIEAVAKQDLDTSKDVFHKLKGMAANISGTQMEAICHEGQEACKAGDWEPITPLPEQIKQAFGEIVHQAGLLR